MARFEVTYLVNSPHPAVARFHQSRDALRRLTPPPVFVQVHRFEPLADGSLADFTMWFGPIPLRWQARHEQVDLEAGFTDRQISGPLAEWVHHHRYQPSGGGTRLTDRIEYRHHAGPRGWLTRLLFNPFTLRWMFIYRRLVIGRLAPLKE